MTNATERTMDDGKGRARLLPCPFCGVGQIELVRVFKPSGTYGEMKCLACGAIGPESSYETAIDNWNRRPMSVLVLGKALSTAQQTGER